MKVIHNFVFSRRSESNLNGVNPTLIKVLRLALVLSPVDFIVIEGVRTLAQQRENVKKGVSKTLASRHLSGHAVDVFPVGGDWNNYRCWLPVLDAVYRAAEQLSVTLRFGITWTGNPHDVPARFLDAPHIELPATR